MKRAHESSEQKTEDSQKHRRLVQGDEEAADLNKRMRQYAAARGHEFNDDLKQRYLASHYFTGYPKLEDEGPHAKSNAVLAASFPRYYANFGLEGIQLKVDKDKKEKGKLWPRLSSDGQRTKHMTVWGPRMPVFFPKVYPFGNRDEDHPKGQFLGTSFGGAGAYKYKITSSSNLSKDEEQQDPRGKHFCDYVKMLNAHVASMIWKHEDLGKAPRTSAEMAIKGERETVYKSLKKKYDSRKANADKLNLEFEEKPPEMEPITEEDLLEFFLENILSKPSRVRTEKDDPEDKNPKAPRHDLPGTDEVRGSSNVFSEVRDAKYLARLREQGSNDEFILKGLNNSPKAYKFNELPMYDAASLEFYPKGHKKAGQMIPIPRPKRSLGHGDECSVLYRILPFETNPQGQCGVYMQPQGILFFKRAASNFESDANASMPTVAPSFGDEATGYTEKKDDGKEEEDEDDPAMKEPPAAEEKPAAAASSSSLPPDEKKKETPVPMVVFDPEDDDDY